MSHAVATPRRAPRRKKKPWLLILAGTLLLLYPIVATIYNDHQLEKQARYYAESVATIDPPGLREQYLAEARAYNDQLQKTGHHAAPPEPSTPGFEEYMKTLDAPETKGVMARISIPAINVDLPVFHTTRSEVLYEGAGHMFGSSLPVGGPGTNTVISAHTGMVNASMFDELPKLKNGDIAIVDVMGQRLTYKMTSKVVVGPFDYESVTYEPGKDKMTLVTCTPYGINTDRLLVTLERVEPTASENTDMAGGITLSWWMKGILIVLVLALLVILVMEWRRRARRKAAAAKAADSLSTT
ncbi:class C sortase [Corynebacterium tapiri]|uniref:class C sortase n=1 Tax=Corynebacterium tapiri TaxID=1448266 RepID=UPI001FE409A6|nr:class C sortase [Corynebacterium tapiri]